MTRVRRVLALVVLVHGLATALAFAGHEPGPGVIPAYPKACTHGLHHQPRGGPFAVLIFCDDALGSQLAVVCYAPGCGDNQPPPWSLTNRFWQVQPWATDVTAVAWDANGACLYVSTSQTYGSGDLFALNVRTRRFAAIPVRLTRTPVANTAYTTVLRTLDTHANLLTYDVEYADTASGEVRESRTLTLPACQ
jgi:hypothetical protein